jgi:calcineurin-like phosphoesterase
MDSVIGMKKEQAIARFLYQTPHRFEVPRGPMQLNGVFLDIDENTGKANAIERIQIKA